MNEIKYIKTDQLTSPDHDSRMTSNFEADQELTASIKSMGVLLPLLVRKKNRKYEIIAGHRRYKCAVQAGLLSVPCVVQAVNETDCEKIKIHENLHRLPLGHIEQGFCFLHLLENFNMSELQISVLVGKSVPYVSQHLTLIRADSALVKDVNDGRISFSVARELIRCNHSEDLDYLREWAGRDGTSVDVVRSWVDEANNRRDADPPAERTEPPSFIAPPQDIPTFVCQACDFSRPIRELVPVRFCTTCHAAIIGAIREERLKNTPETTVPA